MKKHIVIGALAAGSIVAILSASAAEARVIYVDAQKGNNGNSGGVADPYKSIPYAVGKAVSGDDVSVNNGTYSEYVLITQSGVDLMATKGHSPVIKGAIEVKGNYVSISGFTIDGGGKAENGILLKTNHHVRIEGNVVHGHQCNGIGGVQNDYITVQNNVTYGNAFTSPWQCSGISFYQPRAIDNAPGFKFVIAGNVSYGNENKVSPHNGGPITDGNGIILDDFKNTQRYIDGPKAPYLGRSLVENNIVFDNGGRGVHIFETDNVVVRNNTSYKNLRTPSMGTGNGEINVAVASNVEVYNNIAVASPGKSAFTDVVSKGNRWASNIAYGGTINVGKRNSNAIFENTNIIGQDPQLSAPGNGPSPSNFALRSSSPARDTGNSQKGAATDILGKSRPSGRATDIGATEQ